MEMFGSPDDEGQTTLPIPRAEDGETDWSVAPPVVEDDAPSVAESTVEQRSVASRSQTDLKQSPPAVNNGVANVGGVSYSFKDLGKLNETVDAWAS